MKALTKFRGQINLIVTGNINSYEIWPRNSDLGPVHIEGETNLHPHFCYVGKILREIVCFITTCSTRQSRWCKFCRAINTLSSSSGCYRNGDCCRCPQNYCGIDLTIRGNVYNNDKPTKKQNSQLIMKGPFVDLSRCNLVVNSNQSTEYHCCVAALPCTCLCQNELCLCNTQKPQQVSTLMNTL